MAFSRTPATIVAAIAALLVGSARAEEAGGRARTVPGRDGALQTCAQPGPGQADTGSRSGFAWSLMDGAGVQVRVAIGKNAAAVNNSGGVVSPTQPGPCSHPGED